MTEKDRKEMFYPGAEHGRKLEHREVCYASPKLWSKETINQMKHIDIDHGIGTVTTSQQVSIDTK